MSLPCPKSTYLVLSIERHSQADGFGPFDYLAESAVSLKVRVGQGVNPDFVRPVICYAFDDLIKRIHCGVVWLSVELTF